MDDLTLKQMKAAILEDRWNWTPHRGPNDVIGHQRYEAMVDEITAARSWDSLLDAAPASWQAAVVNRCHRKHL